MTNSPANKTWVQMAAGYCVLATLIFLPISPNTALFFYGDTHKSLSMIAKDLIYILMGAIPVVFLILLGSRFIRMVLFMLTPLVFLAPALYYGFMVVGQNPRPDICLAILNTNFREAYEFIGLKNLLSISAVTFIMVIAYLYLLNSRYLPPKLGKAPKFFMAFFIFCLPGLLIARDIAVVGYSLSEAINRIDIHMGNTYPYGTVRNFVIAFKRKNKAASRLAHIKNFTFKARKSNKIAGKEVYVLVLGESARFANFSLNGYYRPTSPNLDTMGGLISFSNAVASAVLTHDAVPIIISRAAAASTEVAMREKTILSAFREAGFTSYWLSNHDIYSTSLEPFVNEADHFIYTLGYYNIDRKYDDLLLPELDKILQSDSDKLFLLIHTMGSHYIYSYRYPDSFEVFKPAIQGFKAGAYGNIKLKTEMLNAYDNSILFTDYILSEIIRSVDSADCVGAVLYTSDHAENLWDDERNYFGHGIGEVSKAAVHVPMFLWLSREYRETYPVKSVLARMRDTASISHSNLFYSLLDLADVAFPGMDTAQSFFHQAFIPQMTEIKGTRGEIVFFDDLK